MKRQRPARLIALFFLGWLLFSFPLLSLWDRDLAIFGLPLFPTGLFVCWAVLIITLAWLMERGSH